MFLYNVYAYVIGVNGWSKVIESKKIKKQKIKTVKEPEEMEVQLPEKHGITKEEFYRDNRG